MDFQKNISYTFFISCIGVLILLLIRSAFIIEGRVLMYPFSEKYSVSRLTKELKKIQVQINSLCSGPEEIPYINVYRNFYKGIAGFSEAAVWSDFILRSSYHLYQLTGDSTVLQDNYLLMSRWVQFIRERAEMPSYTVSEIHSAPVHEIDSYLWNSDPYFFHGLITEITSQPKFLRELPSELAAFRNCIGCENTLYYAFCVKRMTDIARILEIEEDTWFYEMLYEKILSALQNTEAEHCCNPCDCICIER